MSDEPTTLDGRDAKGRFRKGCAGGPGNPHVRRLAAYRVAIAAAVTPAAPKKIIAKLVAKAEEGELAAIRELLDRLIGRPQQASSYVAGGGLDFSKLRTADDVIAAGEQLAQAVAAGTISPDDASRVGFVLELVRKGVETGELEKQIQELRALIEGQRR